MFFASLLIPASVQVYLLTQPYYSTDFLVHRNWLAITKHLPLTEWYYDTTDDYNTLDYPPTFAYFEYLLSQTSNDPQCTSLLPNTAPLPTTQCVLFQRLTVIATTTLLYVPACYYALTTLAPTTQSTPLLLLLTANPGFLLLDHIHFQYNAPLTSLLLISATLLSKTTPSVLPAAFFYCILLTSKHLYLILAPLYFIHLLSLHCLPRGRLSISNLLSLGTLTLTTLALPLLPFRAHLPQLLLRLFPVSRGLTHAYWAPNVWALYTFADRVLLKLAALLPSLLTARATSGGGTTGLISAAGLAILPNFSPALCALLILLFIARPLLLVFRNPHSPNIFLHAATLTSFTAFMLGYHVHEKAIMTPIVTLTMLYVKEPTCVSTGRAWLRASVVGYLSFMGLFLEGGVAMKVVTHGIVGAYLAGAVWIVERECKVKALTRWDWVVVGGVVGPTVVFCEVIHPVWFGEVEAMRFLPLMMRSVVYGLCNCLVWVDVWRLFGRSLRKVKDC